jgi:two-component system CheB/CheR fusion protein
VGRPVTDLASDLLHPTMAADAREVLRSLVFSERAITTRDGRWFTVRIMPYRTADDRIDGVVITFADITVAKQTEAALRETNEALLQRAAGREAALAHAGAPPPPAAVPSAPSAPAAGTPSAPRARRRKTGPSSS